VDERRQRPCQRLREGTRRRTARRHPGLDDAGDRRIAPRDQYHPIVFAIVSDRVGAGYVAGLPRPGGNATEFIQTDAGLRGKWLALLKEITPGIKRVAAMFNPDAAPGHGSLFLLRSRLRPV
jgi:ABC transporter substrate binding protein